MSPAAEQHVASYDVLVAGQELAREHKDRIKEIRVVDFLRLPDVCTLHVGYPRGEGVDSQPFTIGTALEIRLGAKEDLAPETLFRGQVVTIEPEFGAGGCSLTVRAFDRSHLLNRSRQVRTFQNQTASDIVAKVVGEAGLTPDCEGSGAPYEFVQQDNETPWDFIWRLAERIGFEFVVEDEVAHFRRPSAEGGVELEWPKTLHAFRPRMTAVQQVREVTLLAHDAMSKQAIESSATTPVQIAQIGTPRAQVAGAFPDATLHVATEPVSSGAEGDALVQALLDKLANGYIAAEGVTPGNPKIKAGVQVKVSGVGTTFSGTYRVATSTHVLRGGGGYETHFANSPSHTILDSVGANGAGPPDLGAELLIGIVTNNDDPEGLGRVRVRFPAVGDAVESGWARIAVPSAGKERGLLMLPVVGEEVLVAFLGGRTDVPLVLGSLFNGVDTPGDDLLQGHDGSFALRSDAKLHAEAKDDWTMIAGAKLSLDVTDDVTETFGKDYTNTTTGAIDLSGRDVTIKGNAQVTLEGTATLTLKCGGAKVELSAAGVTISGPMVSIG